MDRKVALTAIILFTLICPLMVIIQSASLARANPYVPKDIPTPTDTKPPTISIFSVKNNSAYASNNVPLIFNVSIVESKNAHYISSVYYKVDWHEGENYVYSLNVSAPVNEQHTIKEYSCNMTLMGISEDNHNISIFVVATGGYYENGYAYNFYNFGSSMVNFVVDTALPIISALSVENKSYNTSTVPLNFIVSESACEFYYVLDGQGKVIVNGNTTLTDLSEGSHSVTVYANDTAGNVGKSDTVYFAVDTKPSPTPIPTLSTPPTSSPTQQPTISPSPTATVPELSAWIILPLFTIGIALLGIVRRKRT